MIISVYLEVANVRQRIAPVDQSTILERDYYVGEITLFLTSSYSWIHLIQEMLQ